MKGLIYCVHCISTGKKYIGQTTQILEKRINRHFCDSQKTDYHFHRAIKKYGKNNELRLNEECMKINPYDMRLNTTFDEIAKELVIKVEDIKR